MTGVVVDPAAEIAQLREMIRELQAERPRQARMTWRRRGAVVGAIALAAGAVTGVAAASGPDNPGLAFVTLSPAYKLATSATVSAGKTASYVVAGAPSTVPADATTVRLSVTVKGTQAGTLSIYPAGNTSGGSGQAGTWVAGGSWTGTVMENVGTQNKLTFFNGSFASASLTATITGYSTQVAANDINGVGGQPGQVLVNHGATSSWGSAGGAATANFGGAPISGYTHIASVTVPAGSYLVMYNAQISNSSKDEYVECDIVSPNGQFVAGMYADVNGTNGEPYESMSDSGLLTTAGGTINLNCYDAYSVGGYVNATLTAYQASSVSGNALTTGARRLARAPQGSSPLAP